ncbi:GCN5-like N-acetyltransferase [Listeria floridensis FSL S10-1187]|uniref:GCN5-like N-acetyltransferase n=1 Tax=Listeria floridensis FSL S10-1187 TaxID=1265817 RepID=A0ABN0REX1_9LIST|nr:GNAT family N-acetyltransferase [Listeria floridensis]EUJ31509.1 GCN5-like N-acetyltransferase [Listeria floridensis FSL S10-1187]
MEIRQIKADYPFDLLLEADPNRDLVTDYAERGEVFQLQTEAGERIGVYILLQTRPETSEIVNIAVEERQRGKGYAKQMILDAKMRAGKSGSRTLEIGTGNSSIMQLALYQRCGFRITHVEPDFFRKHYEEPIFENGLECRDMIRLQIDL